MCLRRVHEENKKLSIGYKVMVKQYDGSLVGEFKQRTIPRPLGKWLNSDDYIYPCGIEAHDGTRYKSGWHIYRKKDAAKQNRYLSGYGGTAVVVKVRVRDIVASGTQIGCISYEDEEVVVSKQILITGEV